MIMTTLYLPQTRMDGIASKKRRVVVMVMTATIPLPQRR